MRFIAALQFLTIIPVARQREFSPDELAGALVYFPLIGLIIGLILAALNWLLGWFLPSAVTNVLLIVFLVAVSGALHLDGFVDTCDGLGGHKTSEDRQQVMRDSRAGAFGMVGVCCLLLVKYVSLNNVPETVMMATLVLMPVLSRWAMVYAIFAHPYARPSGLGKVFKQGATWPRLVLATLIALVVAAGIARLVGVAIMAGIWIMAMLMGTYLKGKFSGLTGDTYGAINEVAEVGVLILVLALS